ncbi:hypothetical protein FEM48_Zijuj10G0122200 [Ziziphus jujuba var. spinosa]|uniref:Uncharacterized protein n=1 Tax=Ziziphus jujuba var. spinosa TaxID=714518 RepID=A0A978UNB4_ZIZJJ|nr:hypothetical protein FEM48_Zijuj10G0122200 [Ziziphus jujuba var. spinosa]
MSCLCSCFYTTTTTPRNMAIIIASLPDNAKSNHSPPPVQTHHSLKPTTTILPSKTMEKKKKPQKPRQPSVIEIERATGAGRFRDTDSRHEKQRQPFSCSSLNFCLFIYLYFIFIMIFLCVCVCVSEFHELFRELEELKDAKFDMSLMNFPGKFEGPLEKKLRETGEFMANQSERGFRSSSKLLLQLGFISFVLTPISWAGLLICRQKNSYFRVQVDASSVDSVSSGCLWSHQATIQFPISGSTNYVNLVTISDYTTKHLFKAIQAFAECYPFEFPMQKIH